MFEFNVEMFESTYVKSDFKSNLLFVSIKSAFFANSTFKLDISLSTSNLLAFKSKLLLIDEISFTTSISSAFKFKISLI